MTHKAKKNLKKYKKNFKFNEIKESLRRLKRKDERFWINIAIIIDTNYEEIRLHVFENYGAVGNRIETENEVTWITIVPEYNNKRAVIFNNLNKTILCDTKKEVYEEIKNFIKKYILQK